MLPHAAHAVSSHGLLECLVTFREIEGIAKCKKYLGRLRARAGPVLAANVMTIEPRDTEREEWAKRLQRHCQGCALCELAER